MDEDTNYQEDIEELQEAIELVDGEIQELADRVDTIDFSKEVTPILAEIEEIKSRVTTLLEKEPPPPQIIEKTVRIEGTPGKAGRTPTKKELLEIIEPLIPPPQKGEDAKPVDTKTIVEDVYRRVLPLIPQMGSHANRNIAIGGNSSTLSRYTDINLKPGSNVTITYQNNDTTKYTDVTISSSGGGGSVIGTTRSINNISTSQTAGDTSGTDYVYICSAGIALTLPTAAGNTNLYTVKNTSTSSVLVNTTGGEMIDTSPTVIMPVQFTSVDLISDSTNWQIT